MCVKRWVVRGKVEEDMLASALLLRLPSLSTRLSLSTAASLRILPSQSPARFLCCFPSPLRWGLQCHSLWRYFRSCLWHALGLCEARYVECLWLQSEDV